MNSRERKRFWRAVEKQFGFSVELPGVLLQNQKGRVFLATREAAELGSENLRVEGVGLYIAQLSDGEVRLSVEGSQLLGPKAKKGVVELSEEERDRWVRGEWIAKRAEQGFVIIKCGKDFFGCGKSTGERILNYYPKSRRISAASS